MDSPRFSRDQLALLIGVPLAWAVLLLFHPTGEGESITYAELQDQVTRWMVVRGVEGAAARVSRISLVPFLVFYGAFETLVGIGTGILVHDVNGLAARERAVAAPLVEEFNENVLIRAFGVFSSIGSIAFIASTIAAGVALRRRAGAPLAVPILLGLSGFLITAHPPPFGPTGLALFIAAVLLFARSRTAGRALAT
jgi:hypothetical protein